MNIYIYGSSKFNKEIYELLEHSNAKFRLGDNGKIIELNTLMALKNAIENDPEDMFLIDDSKIIKKNSLNSKFKFLIPKNGIEEEYLLDHGIGDMSVESLDELTKYVIRKLDSLNVHESEDIQESIQNIVDEAYEDDYEELDDELSCLLVHDKNKNIIEKDESKEIEEDSSSNENINDDMEDFFNSMPKMEDDVLATSSTDYFNDFINEENEKVDYRDERREPLADLNLKQSDSGNQLFLNELDRSGVKENDLLDLEDMISTKLSQNSKKKI